MGRMRKNQPHLDHFRLFSLFLRPSFLWNSVLDCPGGTLLSCFLVHEVQAVGFRSGVQIVQQPHPYPLELMQSLLTVSI